MKGRLEDHVLETPERANHFVREWLKIHSAFLGTTEQDMRNFINYLDRELTKIVCMLSHQPFFFFDC